MKKLLIFLLLPLFALAQTSTGQEQEFPYGILVPVSVLQVPTTTTWIGTFGSDGTQGKVAPENISIPQIPTSYVPTSATIGGHLAGINTAIANIPITTAGNITRVWYTADGTTVGGNPYYQTGMTKGTAASAIQSVVNNDDEKKYFTQDVIGNAAAMVTLFPPGAYSGNLSVSTTPNSASQRFTVELYKCNNAGTPIASGIAGAPVGDLGVTVILILDSGIINLADSSITNVTVSGSLLAQLSVGVGERIRYHVSAAKVGTASASITESVYYGTSYNSYLDVPTPLTSSGVANASTVTGANVTVALDNLNVGKENISNKSNSYTVSSSTTYASTKALVDGLAIKANIDDVTTSFPLNVSYATPTASGINLISSELFTKGTVTEIKINAVSSGIISFAFFRKISSSPLNYKVIKNFSRYVNAGINTIQVEELSTEDFYFGVTNVQTLFYTAVGSSGDPVDLHYLMGGITDAAVWSVSTGRGTNIEIKVNETVDKSKHTGKSICLIGDSITDFCDSPASNGEQYIGYDYFINQKLNFKNIFNEGYSGIQLGQSGGFANTKVAGLPVADDYTIYLGTNDFAYGTQTILGDFDDYLNDTGVNTFYGALRVLLDGIYVKNPYAKIILFTPTFRNYGGFNSWDTVNSNGNTMLDFVNAILLVGQQAALPVVDLYAKSSINGYNSPFLTYDNLHPNTRGYQFIAEAFIQEMFNSY